jgi:hypothetical protein
MLHRVIVQRACVHKRKHRRSEHRSRILRPCQYVVSVPVAQTPRATFAVGPLIYQLKTPLLDFALQ